MDTKKNDSLSSAPFSDNTDVQKSKKKRNRRKNKKITDKEPVEQVVEIKNTIAQHVEQITLVKIENTDIQDNSVNTVVSAVDNAQEIEVKMNPSEKSREEIKAEREAKKLAKQAAKGKKKEPVVDVKPVTVSKVADSPSKSVDTVDRVSEVIANVIPAEKSRDDIKAEREAKKLAKQAAKNKPKASAVGEDPKPITSPKNVKPASEHEIKVADISEGVAKISIAKSDATEAAESGNDAKSKADLRAERRAKQEAQRQAKQQLQAVKVTKKEEKKESPKPAPVKIKERIHSPTPEAVKPKDSHKVKLFNHLYIKTNNGAVSLNYKDLHPAIISLGVQYTQHIIKGSNARCIAFLNALTHVIRDYTLPDNKEFSRGFESHLELCVKFLNSCRPLAVSMINALKSIKSTLTQFSNDVTEEDAKKKLIEDIQDYIENQINKAAQAIAISVIPKISNEDVILTYGCSSLIEYILIAAAKEKSFKVIVVAANPWNEGREMLRRLSAHNIKCSLVMISALSFIMREVKTVVLGAGALLANGYVMARAGTAQVAMVAQAHNVPVLVCCETYKFSERVQTDSFVYNEIGDPDELVKCYSQNGSSPLTKWRDYGMLTPLNLMYDVTPPDLVTAVVTELAIIPCTSVPVILRIVPKDGI